MNDRRHATPEELEHAQARLRAMRKSIADVLWAQRLWRPGEHVQELASWARLAEIVGLQSSGSLQDAFAGTRVITKETWTTYAAAVEEWVKANTPTSEAA